MKLERELMKKCVFILPLVMYIIFLSCSTQDRNGKEERWLVGAPAGLKKTKINHPGTTVLPNGRLLTPRGRQVQVAPHPYGLILSRDNSLAVTANSGIRPFSLSLIQDIMSAAPKVRQIPPGVNTDKGVLASVYMGLALSEDNKTLFVGGGQEGKIIIFDVPSGERIGEIEANFPFSGQSYEESYIGDLVMSPDGKIIYALDQANFRMIAVDIEGKRLVSTMSLGRYPFGIALSPDGKTVFAANVGMFEYSRIEGVDLNDPNRLGLKHPPFSYLSEEARRGVKIEGYKVPGLGDPNVPESFSVWEVDVADLSEPRVTAKIKTGVDRKSVV